MEGILHRLENLYTMDSVVKKGGETDEGGGNMGLSGPAKEGR